MMNSTTALQLLEINRRFYTEFGANFSATRQRIQPGVRKIIASLAGSENLLDLGCGNGQLARVLAENGFKGTYLGLDFSPPLLSFARSQPGGFPAEFGAADLVSPDWDNTLPCAHYSVITAFAVLHHIPDAGIRAGILRKIHTLLAPGGRLILSNWQFLNSKKLKTRIQPWETVGLSSADVEEGDTLLDWRSGGLGLRYAHHFSVFELGQLADQTNFRLIESFLSDGEGGRLALYQAWEPDQNIK
jgi:SAM-dependent methyltransferase